MLSLGANWPRLAAYAFPPPLDGADEEDDEGADAPYPDDAEDDVSGAEEVPVAIGGVVGL